MKLTVIGMGYVGLSLAVLLSKHNQVYAIDTLEWKVKLINQRKSPISDKELENHLKADNLNLNASTNISVAKDSDYFVVAVPTDYDYRVEKLDTSIVENVIREIMTYNANAVIVIKSTVNIGFIEYVRQEIGCKKIIFCPEFLRENRALFDCLYPSRIVIGVDINNEELVKEAKVFANLLIAGSLKKTTEVLIMGYKEAEAVKLFANAYLAMRVCFFNELDTFAEVNKLDAQSIINGVCLDSRIGLTYNNPSFGYGGNCLPKDTKQLLTLYTVPQKIIQAIVESNHVRKTHIIDQIMSIISQSYNTSQEKVVGIYRLNMKKESDNYRQSCMLDIIKELKRNRLKIIIYEPLIAGDNFNECQLINDLETFKKRSYLIVANRWDDCLSDVKQKVYTRDIYHIN